MNMWPGETFVFGFLTADSQSISYVTLEGKVGNEKVRATVYCKTFAVVKLLLIIKRTKTFRQLKVNRKFI